MAERLLDCRVAAKQQSILSDVEGSSQ
jgi:hypothetical protein